MELPKDHDQPVYPQPLPERGQSEQRRPWLRGLTLLDHFASVALPVAQAQLTTVEASYQGHPAVTFHGSPQEVATRAYDLAEAMLTERANRLKANSSTSAA